MAEGRGRAEWARMSSLMALIANCHRDPRKSRPASPADFDPTTRSARAACASEDLDEMDAEFDRVFGKGDLE